MTLTTPAPDSYPRCSCPHPPCGWCNRPGTGPIAPRSWPGKAQHIERVRCPVCGRISARAGPLMARSTLPERPWNGWCNVSGGACVTRAPLLAVRWLSRQSIVSSGWRPPVRPRIVSTPCRRSRSRGCRGRPPMPRGGGAESRGAIPPWRWAAGACGGWTLARVPRRRLPRG